MNKNEKIPDRKEKKVKIFEDDPDDIHNAKTKTKTKANSGYVI